MTQLATDLKQSLNKIQKHSGGQTPETMRKFEEAVKLFTLSLSSLQLLSKEEQEATLQSLGDARFQIDQTLENITHKHGQLKEKILNEVKKAQAQKGYAQYIK